MKNVISKGVGVEKVGEEALDTLWRLCCMMYAGIYLPVCLA